jgi:hypothetical protein
MPRAATGFRAQHPGRRRPSNAKSVATPETNTSFEAGMKADLFDKRARAELQRLQLHRQGPAAHRRGRCRPTPTILLNAKKATGQVLRVGPPGLCPPTACCCHRGRQPDNDTKIKDSDLAVAGLRGLHRDRPGDHRRPARLFDRRQPAAAGAQDHAELHARTPSRWPAASVCAGHRLGLPQQGQLLPVRVEAEFTGKALPKAACASATPVGQRQVRSGRLRAQHHQPDPPWAASTSTTSPASSTSRAPTALVQGELLTW